MLNLLYPFRLRKETTLVFFTLSLFVFARAYAGDNSNENLLISKSGNAMFKKEQNTISQGVMQDETQQLLDAQKKKSAAMAAQRATSDVMIADPKVVAKDWVEAFHTLQQKRVGQITFSLQGQQTLSNVAEIEAMPGGYLMLFTIKTVRGVQYKIIKTSEIVTLNSA